jgi:hypothetical protein
MIFSINLNVQLQIQTDKIERVRPKWMLSPKLLTEKSTSPKKLPDIGRKLVRLLALIASEFDSFGLTFPSSFDAHGSLTPGPSPRSGARGARIHGGNDVPTFS